MMPKLFSITALSLFLVSFFLLNHSKERTITGNVYDPSGSEVIGASVQIPNTKIGTVTDFDGSFTLKK